MVMAPDKTAVPAKRKSGRAAGYGRPCKVCRHDLRAEIDQALIADVGTVKSLSLRYSVPEFSLYRRRENHLPVAALQEAQDGRDASEAERSGSLLEQAQSLARDARGILDGATKDGQRETALKAIREVSRLIELQGKLLGTIDTSTTVNVLLAPALIELQQCIMAALAPFPDARRAVVIALGALSGREPLLIEGTAG